MDYTPIEITYDDGFNVRVLYEGPWEKALLSLPRIVEEAKGLESIVGYLPIVRSSEPLTKRD